MMNMAHDGDQSLAKTGGRQSSTLLHVFSQLTVKQHEVLRFVAENRTSKEIAWDLGISESAVNQRIEGVRTRAGSLPRAHLARAYRHYLQSLEPARVPIAVAPVQPPVAPPLATVLAQTSVAPTAAVSAHAPVAPPRAARSAQVHESFTPANLAGCDPNMRSSRDRLERVVPDVLDGVNAGLSRAAAMIVIAGGMLLIAMVGLGVMRALSDLA